VYKAAAVEPLVITFSGVFAPVEEVVVAPISRVAKSPMRYDLAGLSKIDCESVTLAAFCKEAMRALEANAGAAIAKTAEAVINDFNILSPFKVENF
jgi:hypothetical protein